MTKLALKMVNKFNRRKLLFLGSIVYGELQWLWWVGCERKGYLLLSWCKQYEKTAMGEAFQCDQYRLNKCFFRSSPSPSPSPSLSSTFFKRFFNKPQSAQNGNARLLWATLSLYNIWTSIWFWTRCSNGNMGKQTLGPIRKFQQGLPDLIGSGTGSECTQL